MWITDLQKALEELYELYGMRCCIEKIVGANMIYMTNGTVWKWSESKGLERWS